MQVTVTTDRASNPYSQSKQRRSLGELLEVAAFRLLGQRLWGKLYILLSAFRCFLGHLCTQLAKDQALVSLGPALELHCQSYRPNRRTLARKQGIEKLRATHPWADMQTLEIFLEGFDAGELWAYDTSDSHSKPDPCLPERIELDPNDPFGDMERIFHRGIHVTKIVTPEVGWPVAFHCPLCKETTFVLSPWSPKPEDGGYFRIDKSCMSDEFFNRHNMIMAMEGLDRLVRSRNGLSPEDGTNGT